MEHKKEQDTQINIRINKSDWVEFKNICKRSINEENGKPLVPSKVVKDLIVKFVMDKKSPKLPLFAED